MSDSVSSVLPSGAEDGIPFEVNVVKDGESVGGTFQQVIHADEPDPIEKSFVQRWNRLISQTNWEKGSIISLWRKELIDSGANPTRYSDETWSRRVTGVSPQHVGRLRRVYDRFHPTYASYEGLYWTHFLAALDWEDAELWLEGASQSRWSVSEMRRTRWESMGGDPHQKPQEAEVIAAEADEDFEPLAETENEVDADRQLRDGLGSDGPLAEGPDFGDADDRDEERSDGMVYDDVDDEASGDVAAASNPFADLPVLPVDLAEAMEQFKLAIVRHRMAEWQDVSPATVQQVLNALAAFVRG